MVKTIIIDPGHGMSNRKRGLFDSGAVSNKVKEADVVMDWANALREILLEQGHRVIRTRVDNKDHAPLSERAKIAKEYRGEIMLSLHCNAYNGDASGTETFYRGEERKTLAERINEAVCKALGTKDRGAKEEGQSQHGRLAVMAFQPCYLLELGFIDNSEDREKILNPCLRFKACLELANILTEE